jgi:hypothetical protein
MASRIVEESETVKTAADAERFVYEDSGKAVFPILGQTRRIFGGWEVQCFSLDGRPRAMFDERATIRIDSGPVPDSLSLEKVIEETYDAPDGWTPYFSKPRDAGKE